MGKRVRETSRQVMALLLAVAMCVSLLPGTLLAAGEETAEETTEEAAEETTEKLAEETIKVMSEKPAEEVSEKTTEEAAEKPAEEPAGEPAEEPAGEPAEEPAGEPAEKAAGETAKENAGETTEKNAEETVEEAAEEITEEAAEEEEKENYVPSEETAAETEGGDSVVRLYAGVGYEYGGIKPLSTDEPSGNEGDLETDASITVTIEVKDENGNWVAFDPDKTYSRDTEFQFTMTYKTNESRIENGEKYQLPDGLIITSETSGHIYDTLGNYAGEYYIRQESGHWYVYFEYDTEWEHDPANEGHDVEGNFDFTARLNEEYINNHDDWTIEFPGAGDYTIKLEDGYVTAVKSGSFNSGDGKITYSIRITVVGEDMKTVTLTDTLGESGLSFVEGSFRLDGTALAGSSVNISGSTAVIELSGLSIGTYTLTYEVEVGEGFTLASPSGGNVHNTVSYTWETEDGDKPDQPGSTDAWVWIQGGSASKGGSYVVDGDGNLIINWVITVTPGALSNVFGTTVTDTLGENQNYEGTFTVKRNGEAVYTGTISAGSTSFTYTFPAEGFGSYAGSSENGVPYTIEYQTIVKAEDLPTRPGESASYLNDATVNEEEVEGRVDYGIPKETHDLVSKSGEQDGQSLAVNWTVTVDPTKLSDGDTLTNVTLTDALEASYQIKEAYYTGNLTVTGADGKVYNEGVDYTVTWYKKSNVWDDNSGVEVDDPAQADMFVLSFADGLPDQIVFVTFSSAYASDYEDFTVTNRVNSRYDINGETETEEDFASVTLHQETSLVKEGILDGKTATWTLYVNYFGGNAVGPMENGIYTVTDKLPDGMIYVEGSAVFEEDGSLQAQHLPDNIADYTDTSYNPDTNTITFTIDLSYDTVGTIWYDNCYFVITYQTEITGDLVDGASYTNEAVYKKDGQDQDSASATVTVEGDHAEIDKEAYVVPENEAINQIQYTIHVNYNAADLDPNGDYLILTDTMDASVTLLVDTVSVQRMYPKDGSYEVDYNVSYVLTDSGEGQLVITVPDETALVVTYKVHVNGEAGTTVKVNNNATLKCEGSYEDESIVDFEIEDSHAGISTQSGELRLYKIDSGNITRSLAGAEFTLYKVEDIPSVAAGGEGVQVGDPVITDENGDASFTNLDKDTLYYYVETKAPDGYSVDTDERNYFILSSDIGSADYQALIKACQDAGLDVNISTWPYEGGYILNVPNNETEDETYGFDLDKVDEDGNPITGAAFTLTRDDGTVIFFTRDGDTYTVCEEGTAGATTVIEAGSVHVAGLPAGTYILTETAAPDGYQESGKSVTLEVGEDGVKWYSGIKSVWDGILAFFGAEIDEPVVIAESGDHNVTVTNYKLKMISVEKVWDDEGNENKRPEDIEVSLLANGEAALDKDGQPITAILDESDGWSATFEELPAVDENDKEINYTIQETAVEGYETTVGDLVDHGDGSYSITIINSYIIPDTVSIQGSKIWDDHNDEDGKRPTSITIYLYADGEPALDEQGEPITATATEAGGWVWSFTNLLKYNDEGDEITYTIGEVSVNDYDTAIGDLVSNGDDSYSVEITNTYNKMTEISVEKIWDDADNQDGIRPASITVRLMANGREAAEITLSEGNNWTDTVKDLPVYDTNGDEIIYTLEEVSVNGYTTTVGELTENGDGTYSITVENKHIPDTVDVAGSKTWEYKDAAEDEKPVSITIHLFSDDTEIASKTVTAEDGWAWSFTGLPKYKDGVEIVYTITEDVVTDYVTDIDGYDITNTYNKEKTSLNVRKLWTDEDDQDGFRPKEITVRLFADDDEIDSVVLSEGNDWQYEFTNLNKYQQDGTTEIVYEITEDPVDGYDTVIRQIGNTTTYIIENTHKTEQVNINGTKTWNDDDNQDGIRPAYIIVHLYADDAEIEHTTVTAFDNWEWSFTDLPKYKDGLEIKYTYSEETVEGYETTYGEGNEIINDHESEKIDLSGSKTWDDADNQDGKRPTSITIHLFADGEPALDENGEEIIITVTEDDNWEWSFTGLDKYAGGKEIEYTITEDVVEGYTTEINGMDVVNGYIPDKVSVEGKKTWNDNDNQDGKRPASITIRLYADGAEIDSRTVTDGSDGWSWSFTDLPKYKDGVEIVYTIQEDVVEDYETTYVPDSYDVINDHQPETIEISGLKTWQDNNNQDNVRPASITIRLLADGDPAVDADGNEVEAAVITDGDGWAYSFGNLPKYKDGEEIVYTIVEDSINDYTAIIDDYDVINYHRPGETGLNVYKVWSDNEDQDGIRPQNITIHLMKEDGDDLVPVEDENGEPVTAILDDSNNWTWSIDGLPEYANGEPVVYTVTEDVPEGYEADIIRVNNTTTIIIVNEHKPEVVNLEGEKIWDDNEDQDGLRPDYITIYLLADGQETYHCNVTAEEEWKWSFTGLNRYKDGEEIEYTVTEEPVYGYELDEENSGQTADDDGNITYVLENDHIAEKASASIKKVFDDADNQDGLRPETVIVRLLADGKPALDENSQEIRLTLDAGNGWSAGTEEILDVYRDQGTKIEYTFEELETAEGYEFTIVEDGENSYEYTATNKHIPETIDISGVKEWSDQYNKNGNRPVSITVNLYADGIKIAEQTITGAVDNWRFGYTDLPKYREGEEGVEVVYTVEEELVNGYDAEVRQNDDGTFTIINTEPQITKELQEDDYERKDQDIEHDDGNGSFDENVHDDGWGSWDDADNKQEVTYHVILEDIRKAVNLTVHDYLEDGLDFEPETVTIDLIDNGVTRTLTAGVDYTETEGECHDPNGCAMAGCTFEVHFADELFEEISADAYLVITYKALTDTHEEDYDDYVDVILNFSYMTYGVMSYRSMIVTTETELFGFGVFKYTDFEENEVPVAGARFILSQMRGGSLMYAAFEEEIDEGTGEHYYMVEGWYDHLDDAEILTTGEDGYIRIDGLDDDTYTLTEVSAPAGYQTLEEDIIVTIDEDGNVTFDGAAVNKEESLPHVGYVENTPVTPEFTKEIFEDDYSRKDTDTAHGNYNENVTGDGWGTWDDADNNQVINYRLTLRDIRDAAGVTVHDYLEPGLDFDPDSVVVTLYNGDAGTILEDGYTVTTDGCHDPACAMDGCTFETVFEDSVFAGLDEEAYLVISFNALTNTEADDYTNYKDEILNHAYMTYGNDFIRRSDVVTTETDLFGFAVYKYAAEDGNETALSGAQFALERADGKYAAFEAGQDTNLDVTCYMVSGWVDQIDDAGALVSGADGLIRILGLDDDSYTLIETKAPAGYDIINEEIDIVIDEEGNVSVYGDTGSKEALIGKEVNVENRPKLVDIEIRKDWEDNDNQDGRRPDSITVRLYANGRPAVDENGEEIAAVITPDADGSWNYRFENLPEYENGEKITYIVIEDAVPDYTPDYSHTETEEDGNDQVTWTITNDHTPGRTGLYAYKLWTDADDQDGIRPSEITVNLLADGEPALDEDGNAITGVLSEENGWEYSFTGLPEYADGKLIGYTVEEIVPEGYEATITCVDHSSVVIIDNRHEPERDDEEERTPGPKPADGGSAGSGGNGGSVGSGGSSAGAAKTGDTNNIALWLVLLVVCLALAGFVWYRRRKKED